MFVLMSMIVMFVQVKQTQNEISQQIYTARHSRPVHPIPVTATHPESRGMMGQHVKNKGQMGLQNCRKKTGARGEWEGSRTQIQYGFSDFKTSKHTCLGREFMH